MNTIKVNWVREDEELLEPYEWIEYDDIENILNPQIYHVDEKTIYDFIYGCMTLSSKKYWNKIFAVSNQKAVIFAEINKNGKLKMRGLCDLKSRKNIAQIAYDLPITIFEYELYDEGLPKEYGITRKERLKKQYVDQKIDELYIEKNDQFVELCKLLNIDEEKNVNRYTILKRKTEYGYSFIHELLYQKIVKNK